MTVDIEIPSLGSGVSGRRSGGVTVPGHPRVVVIYGYMAVMPDLFSVRGPRRICVVRTMIDSSRGKVNTDVGAKRKWLAGRDGMVGGGSEGLTP
jgi:hypothetical protein